MEKKKYELYRNLYISFENGIEFDGEKKNWLGMRSLTVL